MRKIISILLILGLIALMGCIAAPVVVEDQGMGEGTEPLNYEETEPEGKLSADGVDRIPNISFIECLSSIRVVNPEMTEQEASDNCYTIEAVNQDDVSLCDEVSESFRSICLAQFK